MEQDIKQAVEILRKGGVIIYPTDTIWGIGCDATNPEAVKRVYEIKQRADSKSLILLVPNLAQLERIVPDVPDAAYQLMDVAVEPITIIYDEANGVAPECKAEDGSVAIRVTSERFSNELCRRLGRPLVSTSANISGEKAPRCFADINPQLLEKADYVCQSRRDEPQNPKASTIIKVSKGNVIKVIR